MPTCMYVCMNVAILCLINGCICVCGGEGLQAPTIVDMFEITHCTGDCLRCGRVPYRNGRRNRIPNAQISQINSFFPTIDFVVKTGSKLNNLCITDVATNAPVLCRRTCCSGEILSCHVHISQR